MKQIVAMIVLAALVASCDASGGGSEQPGDFSPPLPKGVYVGGQVLTADGGWRACYWTGGRRIMLDATDIGSISRWDGKLLITGSVTKFDERGIGYIADYYYWLDGKRYNSRWDERAVRFNGKTFTAREGKCWIDDVGYTIPDFFVTMVAVGPDSAVYAYGYDDFYTWNKYYADGQFIELQEYSHNDGSVGRIMVDGGKVYVFATNAYWVDGQKNTVSLPEGYWVNAMTVHNGTIYMTGYYQQDDNFTAYYWIDGVRYELNGAIAYEIFVDE